MFIEFMDDLNETQLVNPFQKIKVWNWYLVSFIVFFLIFDINIKFQKTSASFFIFRWDPRAFLKFLKKFLNNFLKCIIKLLYFWILSEFFQSISVMAYIYIIMYNNTVKLKKISLIYVNTIICTQNHIKIRIKFCFLWSDLWSFQIFVLFFWLNKYEQRHFYG